MKKAMRVKVELTLGEAAAVIRALGAMKELACWVSTRTGVDHEYAAVSPYYEAATKVSVAVADSATGVGPRGWNFRKNELWLGAVKYTTRLDVKGGKYADEVVRMLDERSRADEFEGLVDDIAVLERLGYGDSFPTRLRKAVEAKKAELAAKAGKEAA